MTRVPRSSIPYRPFSACALCLVLLAVALSGSGGSERQWKTALKSESFDRDPGWDGFNNRVEPDKGSPVSQDFGYSPTAFASRERGEVGGRVQRAGKPAYFADNIGVKTLNDRLTATGTFALTRTGGNSGVFFGWFKADQPDSGGRPMNSLGLQIHGERGGAGLAVRLISATNRSCGTFITPFLPGKFRPTPLRADGTRYAWTLRYEPAANGGGGRFQFTIHSDDTNPEPLDAKNLPADLPESYRKEALTHFPNVTTFAVDVPAEVRKAGATFDHFGMMNFTKAGGPMTIYFADLRYDGKTPDLSREPGWEGSGNRAAFQDHEQVGAHDYGFSPATGFAGGKPGEVGGLLWRGGAYSYYADRVGPLTLDDRLEASGRVVLKSGAPDSDVYLGWFNSANRAEPPSQAGHFLGIHVGGPTRVGHYFQPSLTTAAGTHPQAKSGPVLVPGTVYDWSLVYDPTVEGGNGAVTVTLGSESVTLTLRNGIQAQGARFDRFGLFTPAVGGQAVRFYLDDLKYTSARSAR